MKRPPKDNEESARKISRRAALLGGAQLVFAGALVLRMRSLQLGQAEEFRLLADENRINIRLLPPARGTILDRSGLVLASNVQNYRIVLVREDAGAPRAALERLAELIPLTEEEIERAEREIMRHRPFVPVTIVDQLNWEEVARVAANAPAMPGITPEVGWTRFYPFGAEFAHSVGYVGPVSERDLEALESPDPLLMIPRFQIGKIGIEREMEDDLRGSAGHRRIEVNAVGREMRELDRQEGDAGANLQLTLDRSLQAFALARLGDQSAAAVVMEVQTGNVLAMASAPSFDPNLFVRGISVADYAGLRDNEYRPMSNKAVQGAYPPGSTFKIVTAMAAFEGGFATQDERVFCPGHIEISGRRFHCWNRGGHGRVNVTSALAESCDVYFYEMAQRTGIDRINAMAERMGLGLRYDLPLSGISSGLNPSREWKRDRRGAEWVVGDTINASIGQGFVLSTPLQLAVMTARIATNRAILPRLVHSINDIEQPLPEYPPLGLNPAHLAMVQRGMFEVSNSQRGTAYASRIVDEAMRMSGKTGSSQVFSITAAERASGIRRQDQLPWNRRDHALFVCYAPESAPRYAVSIVVEHGGGGSSAAAPIARDIILAAQNGGLPPVEAYPAPQRNRIESMIRTISDQIGPAVAASSLRGRA
ncbi:penicillin-binding protein 2 [Pararhodobacter zhoushanensis]|uniref:Penicillin-binding protein 2 n=1 Tax=Pararhodobacter zhoushanensis TaxID=2479545 RepID=A0ABT3H3N1_9RHOB|nr:penicillin-binding protein 2 [Pararhodobacter zhoushanensis]MCW1934437.1 penicillin-binding protein 2 [Pararhodobacter zhoushanensis]